LFSSSILIPLRPGGLNAPSKPENKRVRAGLVPETGYCRLQPALAQPARRHEARKPALKFPCNLQGLRNGNARGGHGFGYHIPY
jgi:hypothetical protein